jgi:hypothetical protein
MLLVLSRKKERNTWAMRSDRMSRETKKLDIDRAEPMVPFLFSLAPIPPIDE